MIANGHDRQNVSLIGVGLVDRCLHNGDADMVVDAQRQTGCAVALDFSASVETNRAIGGVHALDGAEYQAAVGGVRTVKSGADQPDNQSHDDTAGPERPKWGLGVERGDLASSVRRLRDSASLVQIVPIAARRLVTIGLRIVDSINVSGISVTSHPVTGDAAIPLHGA